MSIELSLRQIRKELPPQTRLVAISKYHPPEMILEAYRFGQRIFGENKEQELVPKYQALPKDIEWHFIGHLQTNKVKPIIPFIDTIHSVDSLDLLKEINKQALHNNRVINVLLQIHIALEKQKSGFSYESCRELLLRKDEIQSCKNIIISGIMGMATNTDDEQQIRIEFTRLASFFREIKATCFPGDERFRDISMGMSSDYNIAIEEGSTMVRIGSKIFESRI